MKDEPYGMSITPSNHVQYEPFVTDTNVDEAYNHSTEATYLDNPKR